MSQDVELLGLGQIRLTARTVIDPPKVKVLNYGTGGLETEDMFGSYREDLWGGPKFQGVSPTQRETWRRLFVGLRCFSQMLRSLKREHEDPEERLA